MNENIANRLFDNNVRIDWMIPLAGIQTPLTEELQDFIEDASDRELEQLRGEMPSVVRHLIDDEKRGHDVGETFVDCALRDKLYGFLVRVSVPVPRGRCGKDGVFFSWGYTRYATLYGGTVEAAFEAAIAWAVGRWEADKAALPPDAAEEAQ